MTIRKLNRRRFLEMAGGAVTAAGLGAQKSLAAAAAPQVLIIGAGIGGVSTGYFLRKLGISSLILEGRDRIGGRLWSSTRWPDAIVDLGGAWIHFSTANPLTQLAKQFNVQTVVTEYAKAQFRTPTGTNLTLTQSATVLGAYGGIFGTALASGAKLQARGFPDQSLAGPFDATLAAANLDPLTLAGVNTMEDVAIRGLGAELSDQSLYYWGVNQVVVAVQDLAMPKGYDQIVQGLAVGLQILYNQVVQQVQYGPQGVTVVTNQGTFSAKYAVITLPIGVLKAGSVQFVPALPAWKQGAINRLHTGVMDKLVLRFPKAFWDTTASFLLRLKPPSDRYVWWLNAQPITGQPVLICFVTADVATQVESLSDAEVVNQLMAVLRAWYPTITVPNPVDFQRSRWLSDPFAVGAYPHIPVGATPADYDTMGLPVPYAANLPASANRLFFAGDGTTSALPANAWGAYESGQREAARIQAQLAMKQ